MPVVERLRRTGQYVSETASKSVGVGAYQEIRQVNKIMEQIGQPNIHQMAEVTGTLVSVLLPATLYLKLSEGDNSSKSKTIQSKFMTAAKLLGKLGIDLSTLVIPIVASKVTQDSLPLLGIIGKPLCNAVVWVASDAKDAWAFKRKDLPRGPKGTYDLLQEAYDENYDPRLRISVIKDPQGGVRAAVRKEEICAESGGSCMVLYVPIIDGKKRSIGYADAHVTEKDVVVSIGASTGYYEDDPNNQPSIEELIGNLKKPEPTI